MKEVLKNATRNATSKFTLGQAIEYYEKLGLAVAVNDGKDVTLEQEGSYEK